MKEAFLDVLSEIVKIVDYIILGIKIIVGSILALVVGCFGGCIGAFIGLIVAVTIGLRGYPMYGVGGVGFIIGFIVILRALYLSTNEY